MTDHILIPAYLVGATQKADRSATLRFNTQELPSSFYADCADLHQAFGWLAFRASETETPELPERDPEEKGKSISERLYDVLFVRWVQLKKKGETQEDFEHYRRRVMESFISSVKEKLD